MASTLRTRAHGIVASAIRGPVGQAASKGAPFETRLVTRCFSRSSPHSRPTNDQDEHSRSSSQSSGSSSSSGGGDGKLRGFFNSTAAEAALGASAGVILLGLAGMGYHKWYKSNTLAKMEAAFEAGYDPVLALAESGGAKLGQLAYVSVPDRKEDELIRRIMAGQERGRYFLILGPKGSGKTTSIIQAMAAQSADGVAFFEAHSDPSIVVDRFSEAINYTMNRDFLGNLVGLSDLSGMSTFQHLERALHKLETALIRRRQKTGRPSIIVMNAAHLLGESEEAVQVLTVLQQRAEKWASAGTATFVITSNDYFVYDVLRRHSNRMDLLTFKDLNRRQSLDVLKSCREQYWGEDPLKHDPGMLDAVYRITGGRLSALNKVSRRRDMLRAAQQLVEDDMHFLLSKRGLIEDCDDDVMDEQKVSSSSWLLFVELAKRQRALEDSLRASGASESPLTSASSHPFVGPSSADNDHSSMLSVSYTSDGHGDASKATRAEMAESDLTDPSQDASPPPPSAGLTDTATTGAAAAAAAGDDLELPLASISWGEARQVMTRADFILPLDHLNLIQIDRHHRIRADSMPLLRAFARVADEPGYEDKLERVMDRISAIESLGRTRELLFKEVGPGGKFLVKTDGRGREFESWTLMGTEERMGELDDGDGDGDGDD